MVEISKEDFGVLCVCALRCCHGRQTYMPGLIQGIVKAHFKDLTEKDLKVIADDEKFQREMSLWGQDCDRADWQRFYSALGEFREKKMQSAVGNSDSENAKYSLRKRGEQQ